MNISIQAIKYSSRTARRLDGRISITASGIWITVQHTDRNGKVIAEYRIPGGIHGQSKK